jgi:hypothetical protein
MLKESKVPNSQLSTLAEFPIDYLGSESSQDVERYENSNSNEKKVPIGQWMLHNKSLPKDSVINGSTVYLHHLSQFKLPHRTKVGDHISTSRTSWHHTHPKWWYFNGPKGGERGQGANGYVKTIIPQSVLAKYGAKSTYKCTNSEGLKQNFLTTKSIFLNFALGSVKSNILCTQSYVLPPFVGEVTKIFKIKPPTGEFGTAKRSDPKIIWSNNRPGKQDFDSKNVPKDGIRGVELKWKGWIEGSNTTHDHIFSTMYRTKKGVQGTSNIKVPPVLQENKMGLNGVTSSYTRRHYYNIYSKELKKAKKTASKSSIIPKQGGSSRPKQAGSSSTKSKAGTSMKRPVGISKKKK